MALSLKPSWEHVLKNWAEWHTLNLKLKVETGGSL